MTLCKECRQVPAIELPGSGNRYWLCNPCGERFVQRYKYSSDSLCLHFATLEAYSIQEMRERLTGLMGSDILYELLAAANEQLEIYVSLCDRESCDHEDTDVLIAAIKKVFADTGAKRADIPALLAEVEARYTEEEVRWAIREAAEGALDDLAPTPDAILARIRAGRGK